MITVTGKGKKAKVHDTVLQEAIEYYTGLNNGAPYLKATEVKGLDLEDLLQLCQDNGAWHISLVRQIVSAIGGSSYQTPISDMNKQIEAYLAK